jgi:Zn-dependent peptidase ImmA (M78 family)
MRGFSIAKSPFPVVVLNSKDSPAARIFTMMHELVHILLKSGGICDHDGDEHRSLETRKLEVFCNAVAAEILVPKENLEIEASKYPFNAEEWDDGMLKSLALKFRVSQEVILRRLVAIGRCGIDHYLKKRGEILKRCKDKAKDESAGGGPKYHVRKIMEHGHLFTKIVLEAYYKDRISLCRAGDYLDMKLKHLKEIEQAIYAH